MLRIILLFVTFLLLSALSCKNSVDNVNSQNDYSKGNQISSDHKMITWEEMIVEINKAEYTGIGQNHDMIITLVKTDGSIIKAKQPKIDAFLEIVKNCKKCSEIPILSE